MAITGCATPEGTARYRAAHVGLDPSHFRALQDLQVSSIGLGTYLGDPDDQTDQLFAEAIRAAIDGGCNLLDAAANYRCQRSERVIGRALEQLIGERRLARDEVILCTKGGYLPFDGDVPADPARYLAATFFEPGIIRDGELAAGCHCLAPRYLAHQLQQSLANLRVETIDVYYLHNPEQQLDAVDHAAFLDRMDEAFHLLERAVRDGVIRVYGTATWNGYRINPRSRGYLDLSELVAIARRIAGDAHHFRVIQLPYNLAMPEARGFANQSVDGQMRSPLDAAQALGLHAIASASLLQSQFASLPAAIDRLIPGLSTAAQRAIQFVRSTPGITAALVGMKRAEHVRENLALAAQPTLSDEQIGQLFDRRRSQRAPA